MKIADEMLRIYREARYVIEVPEGEVVLDIRQRNALTPKLRAEMGDAAGVLATAWNPFGRELPFERNRELNDQFASAMNERGKRMMGSYGEAELVFHPDVLAD